MEHSNRNIYVAGNFIAEQHVDIQILHADKVYTQPQQSSTIKPKVIIAEDIPLLQNPPLLKKPKRDEQTLRLQKQLSYTDMHPNMPLASLRYTNTYSKLSG